MTVSAVAQPGGVGTNPPRFAITIASPGNAAITAISLYRTQNGVTVPTRVQPPPGGSPIVVYDYEATWEAPAVYSASYTYGSGSTASDTGAAATLSPTIPWLIHPTTPALSIPLDQGLFSAMGVVSIGTVTRSALTTKHRILGAEYQIVTKTGPRAAPTLTMTIATVTNQERQALNAILRDQTPLMIQVPSAWGWDWEPGYFDVGDESTERFLQYGPEHRRVKTLALEAVQAPAGTQQPIRTWTTLLGQFATWQAVAAGYASWTDELTDSRR